MVVSFVGAGGKTMAVYSYAELLVSWGNRVVVTTTTHMQYPDSSRRPLCTTAAQAATLLGDRRRARKMSGSPCAVSGRIAVCGIDSGAVDGIHKITGLPKEEFERCRTICDVVLVEADGAKMKPLKAPLETEPVIPSGTNIVVVCAGLDALDGALDSVCFRTARIRNILGLKPNEFHTVTEDDIARIVYDGYVLPCMDSGNLNGASLYVMLNKADTDEICGRARTVASLIACFVSCEQRNCKGVIFRGTYITSFRFPHIEVIPFPDAVDPCPERKLYPI